MEETFRLEVGEDRRITLPKRLLVAGNLRVGDEIRIVTNKGRIQSIEAFSQELGGEAACDDSLALARLQEIREGKHEDLEAFGRELSKPVEPAARAAGAGD